MKKDEYMDILVFDGDDGIKYIRYDDVLKMLERIKQNDEVKDKRIKKVLEMLDKPYYYNLRVGALRDIQEILRGEHDEDNSTSK